jgi:hypothetical protein
LEEETFEPKKYKNQATKRSNEKVIYTHVIYLEWHAYGSLEAQALVQGVGRGQILGFHLREHAAVAVEQTPVVHQIAFLLDRQHVLDRAAGPGEGQVVSGVLVRGHRRLLGACWQPTLK